MASPKRSGPTESEESGKAETDIAQAFQDLLRGEKTAQTLESNLTSLEQKLDDLLKSFENSEAAKKLDAQTEAKHDDRGNGKGKGGGEVNGEDGKA